MYKCAQIYFIVYSCDVRKQNYTLFRKVIIKMCLFPNDVLVFLIFYFVCFDFIFSESYIMYYLCLYEYFRSLSTIGSFILLK